MEDTYELELRSVPFEHADSVMLRAAQRAELTARYGTEDSEPGVKPNADSVVVFLIAYVDGVPAGCGGLRELSEEIFEVKRMYVTPAQRGTGIAVAVLKGLEEWARAQSATTLALETGTAQPDAMRFYEREGYSRIENFGDYVGEELSVCYAKNL
ncbi:GNAT family N-acetyltransferase [Salinibacterium sp. SWN1162]|uniref:GNAT family N-acetyltransferase n=1 Tax=Salinibacterium sp. SWN1162 TaxID=2792053 RepID=UPI0018CC84FD|nr:GNAT family N-acetyltransferase [Salinibacterium sp. SWN1162]MBH0008214.1 GNAT family N-acetyltransferase [Salinibacterium sp. SWN1162]